MICEICNSRKIEKKVKCNSFFILICQNCETGFTHPKPSLPDYKAMDFHNETIKKSNLLSLEDLPDDWINLIQIQLEVIKKNLPLDAKILEIGCGEGLLLDLLAKQGFSNVMGIEPSNKAYKRGRLRGVNVINAYFDKKLFDQKFDLVIMSHVLEHITDLNHFISSLNSILSIDGKILLSQTNYKGLIPKIKKSMWYAWVPEHHFWHFTPKSLNILFQKFGFQVSFLKYCSLVHPNTFIYKISKLKASWQDQFVLLIKKIEKRDT